jgi:uncharacterized membrane protein
MLVWLAHLVIQASSILKLVNLLGFIVMVAGGVWLVRRVLSRRRRFVSVQSAHIDDLRFSRWAG